MGTLREYAKEQFEKGVAIGSDKSKTPREAINEVLANAKEELDAAASLAAARKERKDAVGKRLSQLREAAKYRQKDVAERIGVNVITLSGYEIGKSEPPEEVLVRLACLYGVSLDYLLCRTDTMILFDDGEYRAADNDRQQLRERLDSIEKELSHIRQEVK